MNIAEHESKWEKLCACGDIPFVYQNATLDVCKKMPSARSEFGNEWLAKPQKARILMISGNPGSGKTYFLYSLYRRLLSIKNDIYCYFYKSKEVAERLAAATSFKERQIFLSRLKNCHFLFLDDFGIERDHPLMKMDYHEIIDSRVTNNRYIILTTNLTGDQIGQKFGSPVYHRLSSGIFITFSSPYEEKTLWHS